MPSLPDTFCIFILTHGRPNNVITYRTLEKCGYTGRLYFVVDNEDETIAQYKHNFGDERVIVFDKKAEADACDEGNNFDSWRAILMARNACFGIAKRIGITHFMELDDDYEEFIYKLQEGGDRWFLIKDLDGIIASLLRFYVLSGAKCIAMAQTGDFLGGLDNGKGIYRFSKRKCMNTFLCSTENPIRFIGAMNEDVNTYVTLGSRGDLFLTIPFVAINQKDTQTQSSGMTDQYKQFGTYAKAFTTVMMMPSAVRVRMIQSNHPRIHHAIKWNNAVPCIVSESCRKT